MTAQFDGAGITVATGGELVRDGLVGPVVTDTRALSAGDWFLALVGDRFDGHDFLERAERAGAAGCIVRRVPDGWTRGCVKVPDTLVALQDLGRAARGRYVGPVVGLTGSSGKTTTRTLIALALSPLGRIHHTTGNLNNHIGVPMTLLAGAASDAAWVVEMGTSAPGEIAVLADIASPDVRLIVNIGAAHLEELGGLQGVATEKGALFRSARPSDTLCINVDDPFLAPMVAPPGTHRVTWGTSGTVALVSAVVDPNTLSTVATWSTPQGTLTGRIAAPGEHVAHDAAGALAVALALGVDLQAAVATFERYEPVGMRLHRVVLSSGAVALNDAYNANPQSMEASLRLLASLPGRRVAVLGDMLELGPGEATYHQQVAALAHGLRIDVVVLVGPRMVAARGACPGAAAFEDPSDAVPMLRGVLDSDVHMLLKGSRGARVERVLHELHAEDG